MKKFLLSFIMLLGCIGANADVLYTLDTTLDSSKGTNSNYATSGDVEINGIIWNATGNMTMAPWRIGGKSLESVDREVYTKTALEGSTDKVTLTLGSNSLTLNSVKLLVSTNADFENVTTYDVSEVVTDGANVIDITPVSNAYFKFVFNVTVSGTSNKFVQFSGVTFEGTAVVSSVEKPTFSLATGTYYGAQSVELACATEGATIMYSTDGENYAEYTAALNIAETTTVSAYALLGDDKSSTASATYTIGKTYATLAELAAVTPEGQPVQVTLNFEKITKIYTTSKGNRNGIYLMAGEQEIEIYCYNVPESWVEGGYVSGTIQGAWKDYNGTWEVCPSSWDGVTYFYPAIEEGTYYIQNVASGLFLSGANSWGTRLSVSNQGELFTATLQNGKYELADNALSGAKALGTNLFTDNAGFNWTISAVEGEEGVITISNTDGYIAQSEEAGNHIGYLANQVAEVTDAAKWRMLTKEQAVALLEAATKDAPVDASFLIGNANFSRNHTTVWTAEAGNKNLCGGANENKCAESWRSAFDIYQTITVPNGVYELTAQASVAQYDLTGADIPVVYANSATTPFVVSPNNGTMGDGEKDMGAMSTSFGAGKYYVEPVKVNVTGGELRIGVKGTRTDTWCIWDNFNIKYYGVDLTALSEAFEALLAEAKEILANTDAQMSVSAQTALQNAVDTYEDTEENLVALEEATTALTAAVENAKKSIEVYAAAYDIFAKAQETLDEDGLDAFTPTLMAYYNGEIETIEEVKDAYVVAVKAQTTPGADMTDAMPAEWIGQTGGYGDCAERFSETSYEPGKILYQHIEGLHPGQYEVQFIAGANLADWQGQTGSGPDIAQLFINDVTEDIEVIAQKSATTTDYVRTMTVNVREAGVLEYGLQNIATGGCWYFAKAIKLTYVGEIQKPTVEISPESGATLTEIEALYFASEEGIAKNPEAADKKILVMKNKEQIAEISLDQLEPAPGIELLDETEEGEGETEDEIVAYYSYAFDPVITEAGNYEVYVPADMFIIAGETNGVTIASYTIEGEAAAIVANPAAGEVETLQDFELTYGEGDIICPSSQDGTDLTITDAEGNVVATITQDELNMNIDEDCLDETGWNVIKVKFSVEPITTAGTYTLNIPASAFYLGEDYADCEATSFVYTVTGAAQTGLADGTYLIKNKRTAKYAIWTGDNTQIGQSKDKTMEAIWTVESNGDGTYKLGNIATDKYYVGHSEFAEEGAPVYLLESEYNEGYYVVSLTADASANCWDDQGNTTKVGYWQPSASDNQGTSWEIIPVSPEQVQNSIELAQLIAEASETYEANTNYIMSDGLITSVDQLSSPYTEPNEGSLEALLDGNTTTFWHSQWSAGSVANGVHYLQIALPEGTQGELELDYTRRPTNNDHLTQAEIIGVNGEETTSIAVVDMPYGVNTETMKPHFVLDQAYEAIRILELHTNSDRGYWHASEMQLYAVQLDPTCLNAIVPEAAAALNEAIEAAQAVVENPTAEDIAALKAAIEDYKWALPVQPGTYLLKNKRSGSYAIWTGDDTQIEQSKSKSLAAVWTLVADGDNFKLGNYATDKYYVGHSEFTEEGATVYMLKSEYNKGYYVVSLTEDASASCWDDQNGKVGYWKPSASDNQGTSWEMIPVDVDQLQLTIEMENLIAEVSNAYEANTNYIKSEGLITSVDQLSSPYTEPNEGSLEALLDGNTTSFWHSAWSAGQPENGLHYLEIALPEGTEGEIELSYTRRPTNNDHLTKAEIIGVNGDETTSIAVLDLPYGSNTETMTPHFVLDKPYEAIRILELATTSNRGYWHASEIQLYSVVLDAECANAQAPEAAAAVAKAIETAKAVVETATQADIDALQAAYDAYLAATSGAEVVDIAGAWYENGKGQYYGANGWENFELVNNDITIVQTGSTITISGLLGDAQNVLTGTIVGNTITIAKGQTLNYDEYEWMSGAEDADGNMADLVGTISEDGQTITLPGFNIFYDYDGTIYSYMYDLDIVLSREKAAEDGINGINVDAQGTIYNIAGQRVNKAQKGVYVINGKKVLK